MFVMSASVPDPHRRSEGGTEEWRRDLILSIEDGVAEVVGLLLVLGDVRVLVQPEHLHTPQRIY